MSAEDSPQTHEDGPGRAGVPAALWFPGQRDPRELDRDPCCQAEDCDAREGDERLARAYAYVVAAVEELRVLHDHHQDADHCPPGECACPLHRVLVGAAVILDKGAQAVLRFDAAREMAQLEALMREVTGKHPAE